jgi:hypothetical protein
MRLVRICLAAIPYASRDMRQVNDSNSPALIDDIATVYHQCMPLNEAGSI